MRVGRPPDGARPRCWPVRVCGRMHDAGASRRLMRGFDERLCGDEPCKRAKNVTDTNQNARCVDHSETKPTIREVSCGDAI